MMCYSDYDIFPIVFRLYPPLLEPSGEKSVKAKLILPGHLHDANVYLATPNLNPEQQQDKSASPCSGDLSDPPCVKPKVDLIPSTMTLLITKWSDPPTN